MYFSYYGERMSFRKQQKFGIANLISKARINYYSTSQTDASGLCLKEVFGDNVEFSHDPGTKFDLNFYPDRTEFEVLSISATFNFQQLSTPQAFQNVTTSQAASGRRLASPLATVKVVKSDLGLIGKPCINTTSMLINIYSENEACVSRIQERV